MHRDRTPVGPNQTTLAVELVEIPPNGFLGNAEGLRKSGDADRAVVSELIENCHVPLSCQHRVTRELGMGSKIFYFLFFVL